MSDFPEAIGGLAEGALVARAVEPARGESQERERGHTHEAVCLNCGTELIGPHCHGCGQHAEYLVQRLVTVERDCIRDIR